MISLLTNTDAVSVLTPEADGCVLGEAFLLQSSEFVEDVDVGVIGTAVVLLPERSGSGIKNKNFPVGDKKTNKLLQLNYLIFSYLPEHAFDLFMFLGFRFLV